MRDASFNDALIILNSQENIWRERKIAQNKSWFASNFRESELQQQHVSMSR